MTNLWSLMHAVAAGCISISMWEGIKEFNIGVAGTWAVFITMSCGILHAVNSHRRVVNKKIQHLTREEPSVGLSDNKEA